MTSVLAATLVVEVSVTVYAVRITRKHICACLRAVAFVCVCVCVCTHVCVHMRSCACERMRVSPSS